MDCKLSSKTPIKIEELETYISETLTSLGIAHEIVKDNTDFDDETIVFSHPSVSGYEFFIVKEVEELKVEENLISTETYKVHGFEVWKSVFDWERGLRVEQSCKRILDYSKPTEVIDFFCKEFYMYDILPKIGSTIMSLEKTERIDTGYSSHYQ